MATSIIDGVPTREGNCRIRSSKGLPIFDETYSWFVRATTRDEPYLDVLQTSGLPIVNQTVSPGGIGVCRSKSGTRDPMNPTLWKITCEFSSEVEENTGGNQGSPYSAPETWIPVYETKFERLQEVVTVDVNGEPIANSVGQPFPGGMTITRMIPVWEFFQFESASITDQKILDRNETVNTAKFKGREPKTLLLTVNSSVIGYYYGQLRRLTQYSLRYNKKKWRHKRLDVGECHYTLDDELLPYIIKNKLIMGPLDGNGRMANDGAGPPAVLEFDQYPDISFSFLRV